MKKTRDETPLDPALFFTALKKRAAQTRNKVERLLSAKEAREDTKQDLGISMRVLFLCGLPLKSVKGPVYKRSCGLFTLSILGNPEYGGVPYGQDRLIPIWLATAFVHLGCPENNTIEIAYLRDILRVFGLPTDGLHYQRLRAGMLRFQGAHFTVVREVNNRSGGRKHLHIQPMPLLNGCSLWSRDPHHDFEAHQPDAHHSITLDSQWADEIRKHPVPIDLHSIKALRTHPGALDFYQFQAWRSHSAKKTIYIPIFGPQGLKWQMGCVQDQRDYEILRRLKEWQALIKIAWPGCPNSLSEDERYFVIRPGRAISDSLLNSFVLRGLPGTPK